MGQEIKATEHLAGYLAIHHHNNNLAMLISNPDKKVRLLLSYVLLKAQSDLSNLAQASFYRSVISQCHLEYQNIVKQFEAGEINEDQAIRLGNIFLAKGEAANKELLKVTNAAS